MTAIDKHTHTEPQKSEPAKPSNVEPILSEENTDAITTAAIEDPAPSGIANSEESEGDYVQATQGQAADSPPVTDQFWRGVFNGVGLALLIGSIPILFGVNLSINQNSSLYQAKVDLVQIQLTQLDNESKTYQARLIDIAANETAITALVADKEVELNALKAEREAISGQLKYSELERQRLNKRLTTINSEAEKPFFAENLPQLPKLPSSD